jgi:tripartite-type tricarboxylate transporter receptor subunit TctC
MDAGFKKSPMLRQNATEFARQISTLGIDPLDSTPDEFAAFLAKEIPRWKQIVQDGDVKVEEAH